MTKMIKLEQQNQKPLLLLNVGTEAQGQVQPKLAKTTSTDIPCLPNFKFLTGKKEQKDIINSTSTASGLDKAPKVNKI
jgi:hypothetical protein